MPRYIYTITCLALGKTKCSNRGIVRRCSSGWFSTLAAAKRCAKGDVYEAGWYSHAVIEKLREGSDLSYGEWWYQASYPQLVLTPEDNDPDVCRIKKPKCFHGTVGFWMG